MRSAADLMPFFVGFAGGSGSGKSTVADGVVAALGTNVASTLSFDAYYRTLPERFRANPESYNFDAPDALDDHLLCDTLDALRAGEAAQVPVYDFPTHTRVGHTVVHPTPVLCIDGILLLAFPDVQARLDLTVFIDAPEATRLARRIARDTVARGRTLDEVLEQYFASVKPMHDHWVEPARHTADLVVDGTRPVADAVALVLDAIARHPRAPDLVRAALR